MMQGDQYRIPIELKEPDGSFLTREEVKDIEVFVGNTRKTLLRNEVEYEPSENVFYVTLDQRDTFTMRGNVAVQARVLFLSGDVVGVNLGVINFETAKSRTVLK